MAHVAIRKDNDHRAAPLAPAERIAFDPLRMMRDLMSWDPFREMSQLPPQIASGFVPSFEVKETKGGFVFRADVPGVKESDLEVTLAGNRLTISGKREAERREQSDTFYTYERSYGDFARSFTLPEGINPNTVTADLSEGVLTVSIAKLLEAQPKKISVQSATKKS